MKLNIYGVEEFHLGKKACITFTKKEAKWSYNTNIKVTSSQNYNQKVTILFPLLGNGGNDTILKVDYNSSPKADKIIYDEKKQKYSDHFYNFKNKAEFNMEIEFKNKCRTEWIKSAFS